MGKKFANHGGTIVEDQKKCKYIKDNSCAIVYEDEDCGRGDGILNFIQC